MIPSDGLITALWDKYQLPGYKRNHCTLVARVAVWFATALMERDPGIRIDTPLLRAAALLHDIDKNAPKLSNEHHPDAGVRLIAEEGFPEISDLIRTHPLHAILDTSIAPKTWEAKLLYLSDKMVKHDIITVDERFGLWRAESLPSEAYATLDAAYPLVKALEKDVCLRINVTPSEVAKLVNDAEMSTMNGA